MIPVPGAAESRIEAAPPKPEQHTLPSTAQLKLSFKDKSWAQVKDGRGRVLVNGLIPAGRTETLNGTPPYTVTLGRAVNVHIEYEGQLLDLVPHTASNGTAYFTFPVAPAPPPTP